jgi:predicted amidohydrolase YtcJ
MPTGNGPAADLILTQAEVWTGDSGQPGAEAVAVLGDRIVAVGSAAEVDLWRGRHTQVLAAQGGLLLPGFNDAHVHFIDGGLQLDNADLKDSATAAEFVRRVAAHVKEVTPGDWILGGGWDEKRWDRPVLPTKEIIDPVTPDLPVLLHRCDLHMALANSVALRLAGVMAATPDPVGGTIVRDSRGEPTGILKDAAIGCIARIIPPLTAKRRLRALNRALEHAASLGVTSVQHMNPTSEDTNLYMELAEKGGLTTRIYAAQLETEWAQRGAVGIRHGFGSSLLRLGALKGFSDGSLGSATAYFFEPYPDAPDTRGLLTDEMQPRSAIFERLLRADKANMQLCLHAIGDQAVSLVLDLFHQIVQANGARDRRLRIEHAQHVAVPDFTRFARLGVIASVQPYHAIDDGCWAEQRIGAHRLKTSYPYRSFLDHGVFLAIGTDWYVAPLNPMLTLYAATTRATLDGKNPAGWIPEQKLSMIEAVTAYTSGSAYAEFQEHEKGSITPGKLADMVLLSDNIFRIDPARVRDVKVDTTIMGGKITYQRSK